VRQYLTIPNALTALRGLGVPLFIWLALDQKADGWAIFVLAIGGITDYLDGKLARLWNQTSRFGELADPAIDRIYIVATLIVLYLREALPLWVIIALLARDLLLAAVTIALTRNGLPPLKVTYLGKAATFNLLYAFPFLLLALSDSLAGTLAFIFGWAFAIWGIGLYLVTGVSYFLSAVKSIRVPPSQRIITINSIKDELG
jgi:cardiolipin synthase